MTSYIGKNCTIKIDGKPLRRKLAPPRMTVRERISDWISGGALTDARRYAKAWQTWADARGDQMAEAEATADVLADMLKERQARLDRIAAQETPKANATVKRMARIARGEE